MCFVFIGANFFSHMFVQSILQIFCGFWEKVVFPSIPSDFCHNFNQTAALTEVSNTTFFENSLESEIFRLLEY